MQNSESPVTEMWPVDRLRPFEGNPRVIPEAAVHKVAASIEAFGWRQPIVVDREGVIIVGHTRRLAAMHLGLATVPVHVADLTEAEAAAYRLADNRTGEETSWNMAALAVSLQDLQGMGVDLSTTGFDPVELPGAPTDFEVLPDDDVKPLDRKAEVTCPGCGQKFTT